MKIVTILGARPQFIKASVVSHAIEAKPYLDEVVVHTGQHYDANMSDVFFVELGMRKPDYFLHIHGGTHGAMTGRMLEDVEQTLLKEKPDKVLVYGDTNSTLAGALAAVKLHIPVVHVEAGLRSFNRQMPEEINRVLTDHVADLLFTPTKAATRNLAREGIADTKVQQVGDVMYDAALFYGEKAERTSHILARLKLVPRGYILVTLHRAENTDDRDRLRSILTGLAQAKEPIIWPLHPRTRQRLKELEVIMPVNVRLIAPVGYLDMIMLEKHAALIATDSGGVQKEAYFHSVPCLTFRDETEWVETVESGWNQLVGSDSKRIAAALHRDLVNEPNDLMRSEAYGDGQAVQKILQRLTAG